MIITNFYLLAGIDPISVNDRFLTVFIDAYDWVMAPNVLGMGLFADGGIIATKPYFSTSNYIHKMSDYCLTCYYDHKQRTGVKACPFNYLYWNFILKHENALRSNPRMGRSLLGLRHLDSEQRRLIVNSAEKFLNSLS
jgi:deoxyribodipyrimidine photolyase-related protein